MEGGKDLDASAPDNHDKEDKAATSIQVKESPSSDLGQQPPLKFPPGYRFCPNDEELIKEYLILKVQNKPLPYNKINDVNLYAFNPQDLTAQYKSSSNGENEWYFFTPRDKKYKNGSRPNRAAGNGYWKATGADKSIHSEGQPVGVRKALVFYEGKPPRGLKTNWIMHEFRINDENSIPRKRDNNSMRLDDWVLCRIHQKPSNEKSPKGSPKPRSRQGSNEQLAVEEFHHGNGISSNPEFLDCGGMAAMLPSDSGPFVNYSPDYGLNSYINSCDSNVYDPSNSFYGNNWTDYGQVESFPPDPIAFQPPHSMMMSRYESRPQLMNIEDELSFYADNPSSQPEIMFSKNALPHPDFSIKNEGLQPEIMFSKNALPQPDFSIKDEGLQPQMMFSKNVLPQPDFSIKDELGGHMIQMNKLFKQHPTFTKRHRRN